MTENKNYIPCFHLEKTGCEEETECPYGIEYYNISKEYPDITDLEHDLKFNETYCKYCLMRQQAEASKDIAEALDQIFSFMVAWYK